MPLQVMRMFYAIVRFAFEAVFGRQQMLHYPLYVNDDQTLLQGQMYFTDRCLSYLPDLGGKRLLDIGCGNGVQALYIHDAYKPQYVCGIDINEMHVRQASAEKAARDLTISISRSTTPNISSRSKTTASTLQFASKVPTTTRTSGPSYAKFTGCFDRAATFWSLTWYGGTARCRTRWNESCPSATGRFTRTGKHSPVCSSRSSRKTNSRIPCCRRSGQRTSGSPPRVSHVDYRIASAGCLVAYS